MTSSPCVTRALRASTSSKERYRESARRPQQRRPQALWSLSSSQVLWFPLLETMMAAQKQVKGLDSKHTFEGTYTTHAGRHLSVVIQLYSICALKS